MCPKQENRTMTPKIFNKIAVAALTLVLAISAFADTIRLKDGSIIKGKITGFTGGRFTVVIGEGSRQRTLYYSADEVESIEFDAPGTLPAANTASRNVPTVRVVDNLPPARDTGTSNPRVVTTDTTGQNRRNRRRCRQQRLGRRRFPRDCGSKRPARLARTADRTQCKGPRR